MRGTRKGRKFSMRTGKRRAFLRVLSNNLVMQGKIQTTEARAKELKPKVERLVTLAKKGDLTALRMLNSRVPKAAAYKLFHEIAPKYKTRTGGYLRIRKTTSTRKRDGVKQAVIEFV